MTRSANPQIALKEDLKDILRDATDPRKARPDWKWDRRFLAPDRRKIGRTALNATTGPHPVGDFRPRSLHRLDSQARLDLKAGSYGHTDHPSRSPDSPQRLEIYYRSCQHVCEASAPRLALPD